MEPRHRERSEAISRYLATAFFLIFALLHISPYAQPRTFSSLGKYEKRWAAFHPIAALKLKKHQKEMFAAYDDVRAKGWLDKYENGGKLDAFRHIFAMAYFSKSVGVKKLRKLGKAREKDDYLKFLKGATENGEAPDSLSSVMDLRNNEIGFALGKLHKKIPLEYLKQKIADHINEGKAYIMKRDKEGNYLDCSGNVIPSTKIKGTWNLPKCLEGPPLNY